MVRIIERARRVGAESRVRYSRGVLDERVTGAVVASARAGVSNAASSAYVGGNDAELPGEGEARSVACPVACVASRVTRSPASRTTRGRTLSPSARLSGW